MEGPGKQNWNVSVNPFTSTRTQFGRWSSHAAAPVIWNLLPMQLRSASVSRGQFWDGLETHIFLQAYILSSENFSFNPSKTKCLNCYRPNLPTIFNFRHSGTLALNPERQSARMSKIKNGAFGLDGAEYHSFNPLKTKCLNCYTLPYRLNLHF